MTCLTHADYSDEMWRFSTSTRGWERVDSTSSNGAGPSSRFGHVMTSVGLELWVHGGNTAFPGEGTHSQQAHCCCCCCTEAESVLFAPSVTVYVVVCTDHDLCDAYRSLGRDVEVLDLYARMGDSRQHIVQRCWTQRKIGSRHDLSRAGTLGTWGIYRFW